MLEAKQQFFKDLSAGVDDAIKIERKELVSKRSETGMINRKLIEEKKIPDLTLELSASTGEALLV